MKNIVCIIFICLPFFGISQVGFNFSKKNSFSGTIALENGLSIGAKYARLLLPKTSLVIRDNLVLSGPEMSIGYQSNGINQQYTVGFQQYINPQNKLFFHYGIDVGYQTFDAERIGYHPSTKVNGFFINYKAGINYRINSRLEAFGELYYQQSLQDKIQPLELRSQFGLNFGLRMRF